MADFEIAQKNDTVTVEEIESTLTRALARSFSDTLTTFDFAGRNFRFTRNDTATATDAKLLQQGKVLADTVAANDNAQLASTYDDTYADTVSVAETVTIEVAEVVNPSDTVTAVDAAQLEATFHFVKADVAYQEDSWGLNDATFLRADDTASPTDATSFEFTWHRLRDDVVSANDNAQLEAYHEFTKTDTVTAVDDYVRGLFVPQADDTVSTTDAKTVVVGHEVAKADAATTADATSKQQGRFFSDALTALDQSTYVENEVLNDAHDTVTTTDAVNVEHQILLTFAEGVSAVDAILSNSFPTVIMLEPPPGAPAQPSTPIVLLFTDGLGAPIDHDDITVMVNGVQVWFALAPENGWTGKFEATAPGQNRLTLYSPAGFAYKSHVTVDVTLTYGDQTPHNETVTTTDSFTIQKPVQGFLEYVSATDTKQLASTFVYAKSDTPTVTDIKTLVQNPDHTIVWTLNESGAPWKNTGAGGDLNLVVHPLFTTAPTSAAGHLGNAVSFPGNRIFQNYLVTDSYVTGTTIGNHQSAITIALYVYLLDWQSGNYGGLIAKNYRPNNDWTSPQTSIQLNYSNTNNGAWYVGINIGGTNTYVGASTVLSLNTWHSIGFTYGGGFLKLYQNGAQVASQALSGNIDYGTNGPWTVGGSPSGFDNIHGYIDDIRISPVVQPLSYFQART